MCNRTFKGLLACMNPQVIEKIMPFFETSLTTRELTQEHLRPSLALGFEVFDIFESP